MFLLQKFLGTYQHSLDEKGRLTIPARFRDLLSGGAFITQGFDRCLIVSTAAYFEEVYQRLDAQNLALPETRLLRRQILGTAFSVETDKLGRILVPQNLRAFIDLKNEAYVVGQGEYFEIWTPELWNEQVTQIQDTEANTKRLATLDLSNHKNR
jgi:MraZ protein